MCGSGMLWHFVSPGLLDILPLGLVVALVLQAASLQWALEPIVYYPFGLLCQFLASAIYVGRRYAAANADNSRLMAQIEQLRAGG